MYVPNIFKNRDEITPDKHNFSNEFTHILVDHWTILRRKTWICLNCVCVKSKVLHFYILKHSKTDWMVY